MRGVNSNKKINTFTLEDFQNDQCSNIDLGIVYSKISGIHYFPC